MLFGFKNFIENTKGVWYNTDGWGRSPKRVRGVPHATEQPVLPVPSLVEGVEGQFYESDIFGHKKVQNDKIL